MPIVDDRVIHQALHGYSDGHRLLRSSLRLGRVAERELAILTDLSGSTGGESFQSYLTGYPVPGEEFYALSRTWPAPEMPRPGCVWTHTLLIGFKALREIRQLAGLCEFMRFPEDSTDFSAYENPIDADALTTRWRAPNSNPSEREYAAAIAQALYLPEPHPIAFVVEEASEVETALLAIWSQQWRSLAQRFRFCTGAINPRTVGGRAFDIQFVPRAFLRSSRWKQAQVEVHQLTSHLEVAQSWLEVLVRDLFISTQTELRDFLWRAGEEFGGHREFLAPIVCVFERASACASGNVPMSEVVELIASRFPSQQSGVVLKRLLLGANSARAGFLFCGFDDEALLRELLECSEPAAFDARSLEIRSRSAVGWSERRLSWETLKEALWKGVSSPVAREILSGAATAMVAEQFEEARAIEGLIPALAEANPGFLEKEEAWSGSVSEQRALAARLGTNDAVGLAAQRVVGAMLAARSDAAAHDAIAAFGENGVWAVLDWINQSGGDEAGVGVGRQWISTLRRWPEAVVGWVSRTTELNRESLRALPRILEPRGPEVQRLEPQVWLSRLQKAGADTKSRADLSVDAFFLTIGLTCTGEAARQIVCLSFDPVHKAILDRRVSGRTWEALAGLVDELPWWERWDRGEALRRTVARRCVAETWPGSCFLALANDGTTFRLLLHTFHRIEGGEAYLSSVAESACSEASADATWKVKLMSTDRNF